MVVRMSAAFRRIHGGYQVFLQVFLDFHLLGPMRTECSSNHITITIGASVCRQVRRNSSMECPLGVAGTYNVYQLLYLRPEHSEYAYDTHFRRRSGNSVVVPARSTGYWINRTQNIQHDLFSRSRTETSAQHNWLVTGNALWSLMSHVQSPLKRILSSCHNAFDGGTHLCIVLTIMREKWWSATGTLVQLSQDARG